MRVFYDQSGSHHDGPGCGFSVGLGQTERRTSRNRVVQLDAAMIHTQQHTQLRSLKVEGGRGGVTLLGLE